MNIVTWNCNGAFRKKFCELAVFDADLMVIQECEDPAQSTKAYREWAGDYLWFGHNKHKGVGVFARHGTNLEKLDWDDEGLELFLPCRINDSFNLVAVWTKQAQSPNFRYIGQFWKYLQIHKEKMNEATVICGDFNSNVIWDEWDRWWNHSDVVNELGDIGISSIYHQLKNEEQGAESMPTLFLQRNMDKPYHIDYAFASESLFDKRATNIDVGMPSRWLAHSDHMPLTFTIDLNQ
jgi:exonuclease III